MKISTEEVSRLLAYSPTDRTGSRSAVVSAPSQHETSEGREAATVEVSSASQEVRQITRLVDQLPDVRTDRVAALKAQIESGTYKVSGEDIADLVIRRALADNTAL